MAEPVVNPGPPMMEVKHIFFKANPGINYFANEAEADSIDNEVAFQNFNRSLESSNKHGCLLLTFNNTFYLLRVNDILLAQSNAGGDDLTFKDLKKLEINNEALPVTPNIIALSNGEDFLAVDTIRGESAWTVIFRFSDFINQSGSCRPFCEIRCSSAVNSRISSICWNPGDGYNNMVAINTDDGALFLAKILGSNNVELNRFGDGGVRCCCWSPKGKQLVIGRMNGSLSQLRLDLTEAKQIKGPEPDSIPVSILWTQTTQFLVVFKKDTFIDFMQLDVPKGAPPKYTNNGDIFISEIVPAKCSCFFVPLMQWNVVLAMTNTASDVVVLVKSHEGSNEVWTPGDIADNRRAAFLLDNFARGSCVYYGADNRVTFSEVESYSPMPMIFLLSQRGSFLAYSIINSDPQAVSLNMNVSTPIPDSVLTSAVSRPSAPVQATISPSKPLASTPGSFFQVPQQSSFAPTSTTIGATLPTQSQTFQHPPPNASLPTFKSPQPTAQLADPSSQKPKALFGLPPTVESRQLGTSTLPTARDMAGLQKAVEEKRREMTSQLQKGASLKGLEDDDQCAFVIAEVRKFEQRLADFKTTVESNRGNLARLVNVSFDTLEKRVLSALNVVEDFASDMVSTTSAQKEEVEVLKERILNHFSQLEYAKSLVERRRDPRYLEHLRSRPLDPASQQKFEEIKKLHNYLRNQVAECRRYFYEQNRKRDMPIDRVSYPQLIYLTLSNHSKIIRRLKAELDSIKERLGLGRHNSSYEEAEYLAVCEASYSGGKKLPTSESNDDPDEITLTDLTAGISKVKLNRESERPDKKPVKLANRKLHILKKCMPEVSVIKVKADETTWVRSPTKTASRPKPMAYPTGSLDESISNSQPALEVQKKPVLPSTTFTVKAETPPPAVTPQQISSGIASQFMGKSVPSSNIDFSSLIKSSLSGTATATNPKSIGSFSPVSTGKGVESLPPNVQNPTSGNLNSSILKSPIQAPNSDNSSSPSTQLPTLAGLLATPISNPSSSSLFSTAGLSFNNPSPSNLGKQDKGLNFGATQFSFGSQQATGVAPTKVLTNLPISQSGTAPPSTVLSMTLGISSPPISVSTPATISSASTPSSMFGVAGSTTLPAKISSVSGAPVALFGSSITSSPNPLTAKATASPVPVVSSNLSDTAGKTATFGGSGGLFSSIPSSTPATSSSIFGSGFSTKPAGSNVPNPGSLPSTGSLETSPASSVDKTISATSTITSFPQTASSLSGTSIPTTSSSLSTASAAPISIFGGGNITFGTSASAGGAGLFSSVPAVTSSSTLPRVELTTMPTVTSSGTLPNVSTIESKADPPTAKGEVSTSTTPASTSSNISFATSSSVASGNLFSSTTVSSASSGMFTSVPASTTTGGTFSPVVKSTSPGAIFSSNLSTTNPTMFSSTPASTVAGNMFSSTTSPSTAPSAPSGLFQPTPASTAPVGLFSSTPASTAPSGLFSSIAPNTTTTSAGGLFGSSNFFSPTTSTATLPGSGFMSSLSISDPSNKPPTTASTTSSGLFSSSAFGTTATSTPSIFGGGAAFGAQPTTAGQTGISGSTTQTAGFGVFGQTKPASAGGFGSPAPGAVASPVFGGSATFGGSSPFGSSFGGTAAPAFGSGGGGSVFGSSATSTTQSSGFGTLAQQSTTTSTFGGSPFGAANTGQQQGSSGIFGSPAQQKPANAGGLFSSSFGSPAATSASSVFGGGGSIFGQATSGAFSAGAGGVAQQGFGFGQTKPSSGSAFGSPPAAASPVFGGGATFGSTSPFGSSFATSPSSTFASTGGSVFGGGGAVPNAGFGTLAQQGSSSPGFVGASTGAFGASQPQQQQPSLFGSPQQQQQSKPVFGGQAFSSWR